MDEEEQEEAILVTEEHEMDTSTKRTSLFLPSKRNIAFVCRQIRKHDLAFLYHDVFPNIPKHHLFQCLKTIWQMTYHLKENDEIILPSGCLDIPAFRKHAPCLTPSSSWGCDRIFSIVGVGNYDRDWNKAQEEEFEVDQQPTITNKPADFLWCCEKLLALRSFYNYSGQHCHDSVPQKTDGSFDVELVEARTWEVASSLKSCVNRGVGTNRWKIPKFLDMMMLPAYMNRMASTGRFHVGFAERGLKNWAKKPASTAQKRGGGTFEGQCAARIREKSMIDHALTQTESDEDESSVDDDRESTDESDVGGACFHIRIEREEPPNQRQRKVYCTRLDSRKNLHRFQISLPTAILQHFKGIGRFGQVFELRTEVMIEGTQYRAHPNYRGEGPWYDFVNVEFEMTTHPD